MKIERIVKFKLEARISANNPESLDAAVAHIIKFFSKQSASSLTWEWYATSIKKFLSLTVKEELKERIKMLKTENAQLKKENKELDELVSTAIYLGYAEGTAKASKIKKGKQDGN